MSTTSKTIASTTISLQEFIEGSGICFDVRSPQEYMHAHIPGAISLPLFTDSQRALVGTAYKQQGKDAAVRLGIKLIGPKLDSILTDALKYISSQENVRVYCWRGGMRSGFVRYFLDFAGIPSVQLKGGYKTYRRFVLTTLDKPFSPFLVGGLTGTGKTQVLQSLKCLNAQIIDLEAIACHRGSVYGEHDIPQPSIEQFENTLASHVMQMDVQQPIWIEDESRMIGRCQIPSAFYEAMQHAPLYVINSPKDVRINRILSLYSSFSKERLTKMTEKLIKRLGGANTKSILAYIEQGNLQDAICLLLDYYDKAYEHAITKHKGPVIRLPEYDLTAPLWAKLLLEMQCANKKIL